MGLASLMTGVKTRQTIAGEPRSPARHECTAAPERFLNAVVGLSVRHHQNQPRSSNVVCAKRPRPDPTLKLLSLGRGKA